MKNQSLSRRAASAAAFPPAAAIVVAASAVVPTAERPRGPDAGPLLAEPAGASRKATGLSFG